MCLYPTVIKNRKYVKNKKNGGNIPPVHDERTRLVPVGCGECIECRKQKARGWQVRLLEDIRENKNGLFVTLTFSDEAIIYLIGQVEIDCVRDNIDMPTDYTLDNAIAKKALRLFNENWRAKYGKALRHWMVTELGHKGTENIHMHGIVWTNEGAEAVKTMWERMYGFTWVGKYVNGATVNYIVKYVTKQDTDHKGYKSVILTSPGIGAGYMKRMDWKQNRFKGADTRETYRTSTGHEIAMPVYWRNKIYTEQEREKLWIQKLDQCVRYVCGEKIDVSKSEEIYYQVLGYHRERNTWLGYGNGIKDWDREVYERQRRLILQRARIDRVRKKEASGGV